MVLLRGGTSDLEVLYLRRNSRLAFHGGSWVFPGGRIDAEDFAAERPQDESLAARSAAVREAKEEAGLDVDAAKLLPVAHWTTPEGSPRRFATWFFMAPAPPGEVRVDGGEIHEHRWLRPAAALQAQSQGEMQFAAPTFVLTTRMADLRSVAEVLQVFGGRPPDVLLPRIVSLAEGRLALYPGDAGYDSTDPRAAGNRHRLWMVASGWRYERST